MKVRVLAACLSTLALAGCTPEWARNAGNADVVLQMTVLGQKGGSEGSAATQLLSDVSTALEGGGTSVVNDNAELTLNLRRKNPNVNSAFMNTGPNDVFLQRYTVRYYRADGRSVPGVDVPYDIAGEMSGRIEPEGELVTSIIVVRHQAKREPPLRNIGGGGGQRLVTMFAEITVYGTTIAEKTVKASSRLEIVFGDFADED